MRAKRTVTSTVLSLGVLGAFLLWRTGNAPEWAYRGRLADEVKRRTGFDLTDTAAADDPLRIENVRATAAARPVIEFDLVNRGREPVRSLSVWADFDLMSGGKVRAPRRTVIDGRTPLVPGERRPVRLVADESPGMGAIVARTVVTANLYCTRSTTYRPNRATACGSVLPVPVRRPTTPR